MNFRHFPLIGAACLSLFAAIPSSLHAGASNKNGNPFGNGTFFSNSGTFSAVIRGENLSGTMLFSTGVNDSGAASNGPTAMSPGTGGSTVIVFQGNTYQGNAAGMWNPSSGSVSGQFWGGQTLSGSNSSVVFPEITNRTLTINPLTGQQEYQWPSILQVQSNQLVSYTNTNSGQPYFSNVVVTNTIAIEPVGTNVYQDSVYMNGSFQGQMQNSYPNQTFTAFGTAQQQQLASPQQGSGSEGSTPVQYSPMLNIPVTVQGVRISDTYTTFNSISNAVPYTFTSYTMTNIGTFGQNQ
jgi:hypothetical protein